MEDQRELLRKGHVEGGKVKSTVRVSAFQSLLASLGFTDFLCPSL